MLIVGAIAEVFEFTFPGEEATITRLRTMQKRLKYGLKTDVQVVLYEMGLTDREIAKSVSRVAGDTARRGAIRTALRENREAVDNVSDKVPSYFAEILSRLIA
jgi:hypothetical protein